MADALKIKVILGSTRQGRFSDRAGRRIFGHSKEAGGCPGRGARPTRLSDAVLQRGAETPSYKKKPYTDPSVAEVDDENGRGGRIYHYRRPNTTTAIRAFSRTPSITSSRNGTIKRWVLLRMAAAQGARSVEQLRQIAVELQMAPMRHALHMPFDVVMASGAGTPDRRYSPHTRSAPTVASTSSRGGQKPLRRRGMQRQPL